MADASSLRLDAGTPQGDLEARRAIPAELRARKGASQINASYRVGKFNGWAVSQRCRDGGMSSTPEGVLAVPEAARRNQKLDAFPQAVRRTA